MKVRFLDFDLQGDLNPVLYLSRDYYFSPTNYAYERNFRASSINIVPPSYNHVLHAFFAFHSAFPDSADTCDNLCSL